MKSRRFSRRAQLMIAGGMLVASVIAVALIGGERAEQPASSAVLNGIADKNRDAAIDAAARFKADAASTSQAAESQARTESIDPGRAADNAVREGR